MVFAGVVMFSNFSVRSLCACVALGGLLLVVGPAAEAMRVSPMVVELTTAGTGSTARIEVQNINPVPMPFEARVMRLEFKDDGKISETPADGDFLVFPPQGLLKPGVRQVVRLQWAGGALSSSRGYYLSINQIPVAIGADAQTTKAAGAQVQVVYHIKVLTTVAPPGAEPKIVVESAIPTMVGAHRSPTQPESETTKVPGLTVTIRNTGRRYALMAGSTWTIEGTGLDHHPQKIVLTHDDLNHILGAGYVAALNGRRTFLVPTGKPFAAAPIKISFAK